MIKIANRYLHQIDWINALECDYNIGDNIDVWRINISSNLSQLSLFLGLINPDEIARAGRYFHPRDKNRFIISRGALRIILGRYLNQLPDSIAFETSANKKPHIKNNTNLYYNISHSGDWILIAVSNTEIGADTELINDTYGYKDVLDDNFSGCEIDYINQTLSIERFFILWTRKEALTKATGKGLDEELKLIPCLDGIHFVENRTILSDTNWQVSTFKLNEHYIGSVAGNPNAESMNFWDIYF